MFVFLVFFVFVFAVSSFASALAFRSSSGVQADLFLDVRDAFLFSLVFVC